MPESSAHTQEGQLNLGSRLADLTRVGPWVESLAVEHKLPPELVFAVNLCLEEALSNVIRHGYGGDPDQAIAIHCSIRTIRQPDERAGEMVFAVEDHTPHFNPLEAVQAEVTSQTLDELVPGGQGIRLLRKFSRSLQYEPLPAGNRLTIGFSIPQP